MADEAKKMELVGMHVRIPRDLLDRLFDRRDAMRKKDRMASFSDAVRAVLERGLREKKR